MQHSNTAYDRLDNLMAAYAQRLHAAAGDGHHVVSPLSAWLMLALTAPLASGSCRERLERALGCDPEAARQAAVSLLENPHPALALAFAAWHRGDAGAAFDTWRRALPPRVSAGPMPTQAEADEWARRQSLGQFNSFPTAIDSETRLLFATAIATEVPWERPFSLVPAAELGGAWASRLNRVMRRHEEGKIQAVARTESAGLVGVSRERGRVGLDVVSVIAAPDVRPASVIAAAYEVAACCARQASTARFIKVFDLPVAGHAWVVREQEFQDQTGPGRIEKSEITIPAWEAETNLEHLSAAPEPGLADISSTLLDLLPDESRGDLVEARQVARARFDTNGFSAAAFDTVKCLLAWNRGRPHRVIARTVEVRFDRPFAAVAFANAPGNSRGMRSPLQGLPAFSAWVTEPTEPSEPNHDVPLNWVRRNG